MPNPTQLTNDTRAALHLIADRLDTRAPHRLMTEDQREAIALTAAHTIRNTAPATDIDELETHLLKRMPYATSTAVTRHEYAAHLRTTATQPTL